MRISVMKRKVTPVVKVTSVVTNITEHINSNKPSCFALPAVSTKEIIKPPEDPSETMKFLKEMGAVKTSSTDDYDYVWKMRGLLNNYMTKQFESATPKYAFQINFINTKINQVRKHNNWLGV